MELTHKIFCKLDVEPIAKPRMTRRDKWSKRPCVMRYWDYCDQLRAAARENSYDPECPLSIQFVIPMPSSWSARKKLNMCGKVHTQTPDLDNLIKAFKDALLKNDAHIHTYGKMQKIWGDTGQINILEEIQMSLV